MDDLEYEGLPPESTLAAQLIAGGLAGITEHAVMHPIDLIKTRMQIINPNPQAIYTGIQQAIIKICTTEGLKSLWRGVSSVIIGAGPSHALYFATYEQAKIRFTDYSYFGIGKT